MFSYFGLDSSSALEDYRQQRLTQHRQRRAQLLAAEREHQQAREDLVKVLTPVVLKALTEQMTARGRR